MRKLGAAAFVLLFLLSVFTATAQEHRQWVRIVTRTRLQALFADLESQWLKAVQQKQEAPLKRLLSEDFQVWTPSPPGDPIPREDWWKKALGRKLQSFELRQLAVRGVSPEISVASFVLSETFEETGQTRTEEHFVADLWIKSGETWRCTDRYWWEIGGAAVTTNPRPDIKPTGKE